MSKRLAAVAVIALLCAFAAYAWLERGPQSPAGGTSAPITDAPTHAATAALPHDAAERTAVTQDDRDAAAADAARAAPGDRAIVVRALLADGRPAAGALVDVCAVQPREDRWSFVTASDGEEPQVVATFTAGANGEARVPWQHATLGSVPVAVRHGVAVGRAAISTSAAPGSTHDVRLAAELSLRVRVVGADDRPLPGVLVAARGTVQREDGSTRPGEALARAVASGADGTVTFANVQRWLPKIAAAPERRFEVYAWLPGKDVTAALDAAALPRDDVVLRIPEGGRIEITAAAPDAEPLPGQMAVMHAVDDDHSVLALLNGVVATFEHVPPGRRWRAWVPLQCEAAEFDGPAAVGETVRVTLRPSPQFVLAGRMVQAGAPLAGGTLSMSSPDLLGDMTASTDANGRFRIVVPPYRGAITALSFATTSANGDRWRATWSGELAAPGKHELGDLVLTREEPPPVMLSGRVVAPRGLDDVWLHVFAGEGGMRPAIDTDVALHADGTFVVRAADPGTGLRLLATSGNHLTEAGGAPFAFGQRDFVVTLRAGARLRATVATESRRLVQCLAIGLRRLDVVDEDDDEDAAPPDARALLDGSVTQCSWNALEPGRYRVEVRVRGKNGAVLAARDVTLPSGADEVTAPPIDAPDVRVVRLRLPRAVHGDRATEPFTSVRLVTAEDSVEIGCGDDPENWLVAWNEPVDLRVIVPGYRSRILNGVQADTTIELEPGIPVDVVVDARDVEGTKDVVISAFGGAGDVLVEAGVIDGRARFLLPDAGEYSFEARGPWPDVVEFRCEPAELTVPEHGGTFTIRLRRGG